MRARTGIHQNSINKQICKVHFWKVDHVIVHARNSNAKLKINNSWQFWRPQIYLLFEATQAGMGRSARSATRQARGVMKAQAETRNTSAGVLSAGVFWHRLYYGGRLKTNGLLKGLAPSQRRIANMNEHERAWKNHPKPYSDYASEDRWMV